MKFEVKMIDINDQIPPADQDCLIFDDGFFDVDRYCPEMPDNGKWFNGYVFTDATHWFLLPQKI